MAKRKRARGKHLGSHESDELQLYIDNDFPLYSQKRAIRTNLIKHVCRGNFNKVAAARGFSHVTDAGARKYQKEFGTKIDRAARNEANEEYVKDFMRDVNYCMTGKSNCGDSLTPEQTEMLKSKKCLLKPGHELSGHYRRRRR